jgi:DNA-binding NtrC family response regulator
MPGVQDDNAYGAGEEAAATLGIPPSTLESKIKQLKIVKSRFTAAS